MRFFLLASLIWATTEAGLAPWPLVARLSGPAICGVFVALAARGGAGRIASLAASAICIALVGTAFLRPHPESIVGAQPAELARPIAVAEAKSPGSTTQGLMPRRPRPRLKAFQSKRTGF